jgi:hypothetical protein
MLALILTACAGSAEPDAGDHAVPATLVSADGKSAAVLTVGNDWGAGYCASIRLSNQSGAPSTDWRVTVDVGSATVTQVWSATLAGKTGQVIASPVSYSRIIPAGGAVEFGFCAIGAARPRATAVSLTSGEGGGTGGATGGTGGATGGTGGATGGTGGATGGTGGATASIVSIRGDVVVRTIPAELYGSNMAAWNGINTPNRATWSEAMKVIGYPLVRWPGGSWADILNFSNIQCKGAWTASTEDALSFMQTFGARMLPIVNFSGYWCDAQHTHAEAVSLAAKWVRYMNVEHQHNAKVWEVGNEIFGEWEQGYTDGKSYGTRFVDFYRAMKAVDPSIQIGAVGLSNPDERGRWMPNALEAMKAKSVTPEFLVIHSYPFTMSSTVKAGADLDRRIIDAVNRIPGETAALNKMVSDTYGATAVGRVKYRMTEYAATQGENDVGGMYIEALYDVQFLMALASHGWAGANKWDARNGLNDRYAPVPHYYAYYLLNRKFGRSLVTTTTSATQPSLRAYSAKDSRGNLTLLLVNNSPTARVAGAVNVTGFTPAPLGKRWIMVPSGVSRSGSPQEAEGVRINGVENPAPRALEALTGVDQAGGSSFNVDLPPSGIALIILPPRQ